MAIIAELIVTVLFIIVSVLFTQELIHLGTIQLATFPLAPLVTTIATLTLAINKATAYIVGLIIENKEMKDEKSLRAILKEELQPLKDDIGALRVDIGEVKSNQIALVTELRTLGVIKETPVLSK